MRLKKTGLSIKPAIRYLSLVIGYSSFLKDAK